MTTTRSSDRPGPIRSVRCPPCGGPAVYEEDRDDDGEITAWWFTCTNCRYQWHESAVSGSGRIAAAKAEPRSAAPPSRPKRKGGE